ATNDRRQRLFVHAFKVMQANDGRLADRPLLRADFKSRLLLAILRHLDVTVAIETILGGAFPRLSFEEADGEQRVAIGIEGERTADVDRAKWFVRVARISHAMAGPDQHDVAGRGGSPSGPRAGVFPRPTLGGTNHRALGGERGGGEKQQGKRKEAHAELRSAR